MGMYDYSPYYQQYNRPYTPYPQQQMYMPQAQAQPQPQPSGLSGRMVNRAEEITANDVPMNAPVSIFPKSDMSEIYVKSWNANGMITTAVYKPSVEAQSGGADGAGMALSDAIMQRLDSIEAKLQSIVTPQQEVNT